MQTGFENYETFRKFLVETARQTGIFNLSDLRPLPAADSQINSRFP